MVAVDVHDSPTDSFFLPEAYNRIRYYPPPFYGMYIHPWLWIDGNKNGGYDPAQWEAKILARMNKPAPVRIHLDGVYSPGNNSGTIYATFKNDSIATINGRVIIVITEDSLFYPAPNGATWHSNVPRDYIPTHNGTLVSIPAGDSVTITMPFTTHPNWNKSHCKIKTWIQNDVMQPDSTKEIWQGAMVNLLELGVEEDSRQTFEKFSLKVFPVPCSRNSSVKFNFHCPVDYTISIYDCTGKIINNISDKTSEARWNLKDNQGHKVKPGIYFYRVVSNTLTTTGKLVIVE
ncbi:MAG: T9SS type A sorting domain-containing protein [candidate division WOR-3 bacterium]|nr:T9SS type A sorting domain-containing protein [candidate division WOR-3 bacterium]